jgi:flagellar motor switch protein FliG
MDELTELVGKTHPRVLAEVLKDEDELSIAIFMLSISHEQAAKVLSSLPKEKQGLVAAMILKMDLAPQNMVEEAISRIKEKIEEAASKVVSFGDPTQRLAEILSQLAPNQRSVILSTLEVQDPSMAEAIREKTFTFEDLKRVSDTALRLILRLVSKDPQSLALALRGASEETREKIFRNLPDDVLQAIQDEMEALGEISTKDIEEGQRRIMMIIRRLENEGLFDPTRDIAEIGG